MKRLFLLLILIIPFAFAYGQEPAPCGTDMGEGYMEWMREFKQSPEYQALEKTSGGMRYIPLQVHIVRETDGRGGAKYQDVYTQICALNDKFDSTGFYFFLKDEFRIINNSIFYRHNFFQGNSMMFQNNVNNAFNMYFVADPAGNCGYFSPSGDAVAISNSCLNSATIAHEAGHFFGLPHTFSGWEGGTTPPVSQQEKVDGTNCLSAGDGFCDTPPDYEWDRWNCSNPPTFIDPNGTSFQPDGTLLMSYSDDNCAARFSPNQRTYMNNQLTSQRTDLIVTVSPDPDIFGLISMTYPTSGLTNVSPNNTTFTWNPMTGATDYHLLVSTNPGFVDPVVDVVVSDTFYTLPGNLAETTQHIVAVKPLNPFYTCSPFSPTLVFTTDTLTTIGIDKPMLNEGLQLFPNPVSQGNDLIMKFDQEAPSAYTFELFDVMGKLVYRQEFARPASNRQVIPLPMVDSGVYLVKIETKTAIYSDRIMIRP